MNNFQIIIRRLVICDVPRRGNGGKGDTIGQNAVLHDPDRTLTSDCILPDETGLTATSEIAGTSDVPPRGKGGKGDTIGLDTILHDPDRMLTSDGIFPDEISITIAI